MQFQVNVKHYRPESVIHEIQSHAQRGFTLVEYKDGILVFEKFENPFELTMSNSAKSKMRFTVCDVSHDHKTVQVTFLNRIFYLKDFDELTRLYSWLEDLFSMPTKKEV